MNWKDPEHERLWNEGLSTKEQLITSALAPFVGRTVTPELIEEMADVVETATAGIDRALSDLLELGSPSYSVTLSSIEAGGAMFSNRGGDE